jgi:hypothetical protein
MEKTPDSLQSFIDEIADLQAGEEAARQAQLDAKARGEALPAGSAHFLRAEWDKEGFDPHELTRTDMEIWEKVKRGEVRREDLMAYQDDARTSSSHSRKMFGQFVMNKAIAFINARELRAREELANSLDQKERTGDFAG